MMRTLIETNQKLIVIVLGTLSLGAVCLLLSSLFKRDRVCRGANAGKVRPALGQVLARPDRIKYDLSELRLPVVTGLALKILVWLCYTRFGRWLILRKLTQDNNLDLFSGEYIPDLATFHPSPPRPLVDYTDANQRSLQQLLDQEAVSDPSDQPRLHSSLDFYRAYSSGWYTPLGVAECIVNAISDSNSKSPPLRAIVDHDPSLILAMAHASTERWKKGTPLSLMDGVPVAVKGDLNNAPYPFRSGAAFSSAICNGVAEATLVCCLKKAGAVIIGVANLQEFGSGVFGSNPNALHGTARNPHNPQCYSGGSSSGSAACVAAGLCPIALCTDGGGSIRIPSSLCGVVGVKPTYHLLDATGMAPVFQTVGVPGLICSSAIDAVIAMDLLTKTNDEEAQVLNLQRLTKTDLKGLRVGIYREYFEHADIEVVLACDKAVEKMKDLGAEVVDVKVAEIEEARAAHSAILSTEMAEALKLDTDNHFHELNLETLIVVSGGIENSAINYVGALKQRTRSVAILKALFERVDVMVTPSTGSAAPRIPPSALSHGIGDAYTFGKLARFSFLANLTGIPTITLPVGLNGEGLPLSLQIMGPWYGEGLLLQVAHMLEKSGYTAHRPMAVHYDVLHMQLYTSEPN